MKVWGPPPPPPPPYYNNYGGDVAQEVRAVVWQSEGCRFDPHPGRVEVSLSKTPNPQLAPDELVGNLHGSQSPLVWQCVCERVNERHKL